nr:MAG TPA: hypothetical protein [Caudoviricetes sp.]
MPQISYGDLPGILKCGAKFLYNSRMRLSNI